MKKTLTILSLALLTAFAAQAQEYKAFRVGVGLGYANPSGSGSKGGVLFAVEPGYRVTDAILLNLRLESAIVARGSANSTSASLDVKALGSYTVNGQYYFNNNNFRPFVGVGLGMYSLAAASVDVNNGGSSQQVVAAATKLGFYPRVGFDAKHFTLNIDYNIVPDTNGIKNSYLGIRLGGYFGGGRK